MARQFYAIDEGGVLEWLGPYDSFALAKAAAERYLAREDPDSDLSLGFPSFIIIEEVGRVD